MSTLPIPQWSYETIREHEINHVPLREIRFVLITDLMKAIQIIFNDPDLESLPCESGNGGNSFIVPRSALRLLRSKLPRFRLKKM